MSQIWKYEFEILDSPQKTAVPLGSVVVHVAAQAGMVCCWMIVDPLAVKRHREFIVHGTGHSIDDENEQYLGTAHIHPFVWHLFEVNSHAR